ncbi:MAG: DUF721 domain-containing protein [Puniceicoccales bacterium]|jgi:hypothetical protein|nr:DUF721 domain-containing protein [Puniceicoccales bacterium]
MEKLPRSVQNLIADFRGLPRDDSPSFLKDERSVSQLFQDILKKHVTQSDARIGAEIFESWPQIVGETFYSLCTPHKITATGALIIKVQNSVIRQELFFQREEILKYIHKICPRSGIRSIVFSL